MVRACVPFVEHTHSVYATSLHLSPLKKILLGFSGYQVLCGGALVFKPKVEYYYAYVPRAEYEM